MKLVGALENAHKVLSGKNFEGKGTPGRPRHRWGVILN
jgi:hypothetical protein